MPIVPAPPDLAIELVREASPLGVTFLVTEHFKGDAKGTTHLQLPSSFGGQEGFEKGIQIVDVIPKEARLLPGKEPTSLELEAPANAEIALSYRVRETRGADRGREYRPIFESDYFHFFGEAALVLPTLGDPEKKQSITLAWTLPDGYAIANSFGQSERNQRFVATLAELAHAIYVGGDFRIESLRIGDQPAFLAMRGRFGFSDGELLLVASKLLAVERDFWDDHEIPYFLMTALQMRTKCCSYSGTGVNHAFATFLSSDKNLEGIDSLFAHELFHSWNGGRIRVGQPQRLVYWFTEGFTDYYASLLELRAGLIDLGEYVRRVNERIEAYRLSPAVGATNQDVLERFWKDEAIEKLPYQRGALLASAWNARIKAATGGARSLDDFMHDLLKAASTRGTVISAESVNELIKAYLPGGVASDLERYVDRGEVIPADPTALGPCVTLEVQKRPSFDVGFDLDEKVSALKNVRKDGPGFKAGLRDGQIYVRSVYWKKKPGEPAKVTVKSGQGERTFTYLPQGKPVEVPRYQLNDAELSRDKACCLAWFGVKP